MMKKAAPPVDTPFLKAAAGPSNFGEEILGLVPKCHPVDPLYQTPVSERVLDYLCQKSKEHFEKEKRLADSTVDALRTVASRLTDHSPEQGFIFARCCYANLAVSQPQQIPLTVHMLTEIKKIALNSGAAVSPVLRTEALNFFNHEVSESEPAGRKVLECLRQLAPQHFPQPVLQG